MTLECRVSGSEHSLEADHVRATNEQNAAAFETTFGLHVQLGLDEIARPSSVEAGDELAPLYGLPEMTSPASDAGELTLIGWQEAGLEPLQVQPEVEAIGYEWQVLPVGLMYKAYLAGEKESRIAAVWLSSKDRDGMIWETALGGHAGLLRYGTTDTVSPEGWQLDLEGAALPRVDFGNESDLEAVDFRIGFLSTWRFGKNAFKAGYYHLSSHVGDEFLIRNPTWDRLNYVRDAGIIGWTHHLTPNAQVYGEVAYAFNHEDGALPLEFQYGIQYSPLVFGLRGAPFGAVNFHTREDFNYITSVNVQGGWQWRGVSNHTFRVGMQYYTGPALQYSFAGLNETLLGGGMWFDF